MVNKQKLISTFFDLVKIDSISGEEDVVRDFIARRLNSRGIQPEVDKSGNLFARTHGNGEPVILCAHMDTVEPGRGIKPQLKNGYILSDGTTILGADDKVAIAAILESIDSVDKNKRKPIEFVFSVREETDGGINNFDFSKLSSRLGLVADRSSPVGTIVYTSPWIENLEINILGRAAHAGMPEKGINAITIASKALSKLTWGRIDGNTTANIGIIKGGDVMNSVPGHVELIGEVRSFDPGTLEKVIKNIEKEFKKESVKDKAKILFRRESYCPGYVYKRQDSAIKAVVRAFKKIEVNVSYTLSFGGSDANTFIANGIDIVNVGDGSEYPHTTKERISVKSLLKLTEFFSAYITEN